MNEEIISVICTVKNGGKTINNTIESVISQTFIDWEMVIIDDGSSDDTIKIIEEYIKKDKRIKVHLTGGIGRGKALNTAIDLSNGEYIANIDADDLMHPKLLDIQLGIIKKNPAIFLISTSSMIIYDMEIADWSTVDIGSLIPNPIGEKILIKNPINHSSVLMNKKKLKELGKYDEKRKGQFDFELWLRAYENNEKMIKINAQLVAKRIHLNQSFENKSRLLYLMNAQILKINYSIRLKRRFFYNVLQTPFIVLLGLLPFNVRRRIKQIIKM